MYNTITNNTRITYYFSRNQSKKDPLKIKL